MSEPPIRPGTALEPVLVGPPVGTTITTWDEDNQRQLWRLEDHERLAALLGRGSAARSPMPGNRFRECVLLDHTTGTAMVMGRWPDEDGHVPSELFELTPINTDVAAHEPEWRAFRSWIAETTEAAFGRGEYVAVELGGWEPPQEPYVLLIATVDLRGVWMSTVETAPAQPGAILWDDPPPGADGQTMTAPATVEAVRASSWLVVEAVQRWARSPHDLGIAYGPAPDGPHPALA